MKNKIIQKHKAISTIIGTIIFLVLMVATFGALITAFQLNADIFQAQLDVSNFQGEKALEKFKILPSSKPSEGNRLFVQVTNEGSKSIEVRDLWISNTTTDDNFATNLFEIDFRDTFVPIGDKKQILANQGITLTNGLYEIKVVTKLGNIQIQNITVPLDPLRALMRVIPSHFSTGNNATLILEVQNKGNTTINGVRAGEPLVFPPGAVDAVVRLNFQNVTDLEPQEIVTWKWNYRLFGGVGTFTNFTTAAWGYDSVTGENVTSNTVREEIRFIPSARAVLQRPDVNMVVPSPFGDTNTDRGIWGVVISNPTDIDITVSRVVMTVTSPQASAVITNGCTGAEKNALFPNDDDEWSCPAKNVIQWINIASPVTVSAQNATTFMVQVETGNTFSNSVPDPAILVTASVFTSYGQTSQTGFLTGMEDGNNQAIVNTYLAAVDTGCCLDDDQILSGEFKIPSGEKGHTFRVAISEWSDSSGGLAIGSRLLINVPSGFKNVAITDSTGFSTPTVTEFSDGSTQVVGTTTATIGVSPTTESLFITFTADIPQATTNVLFLMIALVDGQTDTGFPVGAIAEIPLQVSP